MDDPLELLQIESIFIIFTSKDLQSNIKQLIKNTALCGAMSLNIWSLYMKTPFANLWIMNHHFIPGFIMPNFTRYK